MKKQFNIVLTALSVIALMGVVSCKKVEELEGNSSTIRFGVSTIYENGPATKTEYSGKDQNNHSITSTSTAERINWLPTDTIRIHCAQASVEGSSDKYADYAITPSAGSPHTATIAPVGKGLQWGTGSHDFYALYPSTVQNGASTIGVSGTGATVGGTIPATQTATRSGYIFKPDMDYAYMYAVKAGVSKGADVSLDFKPLVTTLEFTLLTKAGDPITSKLTSVKLSSSQTTSYLTGTFTAELTASGLTPVTDITDSGNEITITLPDGGVQLSTNAAEAYTVTFLTLPLAQTELTLTLGFADSSMRTLQLKDNGSWITVPACKKTYIWKLDAPRSVARISGGTPYKFGDVYLTNGILKKTDSTFSIEEDPFVLCTAYGGTVPTQGSSSGTRYYFNYIELGRYFSNNPSFNNNSGDILAVETVSYSGHNWRMPSQPEWAAATRTSGRKGSTVNGTSGARYALVLVDLTGSVHDGEGLTGSNYMKAMLLFPDGATVTCKSINSSSINATYFGSFSTVTYADISTLVSGGCIVLPAAGDYGGSAWYVGGGSGIYWSGTSRTDQPTLGYQLSFNSSLVKADASDRKVYFYPVVLARPYFKFSVSSSTAVEFSKGNLQAYFASPGNSFTWRFAEHQWSYVGDGAANTSISGNGSVSAAGAVDLFGWSTEATKYGINPSESNSTYNGTFKDWGSDPSLVSTLGSGWRTLSSSEWTWLLGPSSSANPGINCRTSSVVSGTDNARYCKATVNGVSGLVIFPDSYSHPSDVTAIDSASVNDGTARYDSNSWTGDAWTKMEAAGCVFLPAAGFRNGTTLYSAGSYGVYWSGTPSGTEDAYYISFTNSNVGFYYNDRAGGSSVRLVANQ